MAPSDPITSLEYFVRWNRADFRHHHAAQISWLNWLIPPAQAELPPQYQRAFSLYLELNHQTQSIQAEWYSRMVLEPNTFRFKRKSFGEKEYQRLHQNLSGKIACVSQVKLGWAGPSPEYLVLKTLTKSQLIYASQNAKNGPDGPGSSKRGERHYLCSATLAQQLQDLQTQLRD